MIQLIIDEKIVDEQLMTGKTIPVRFITMFNGKKIVKTFPNDFTPEQQMLMKQIYDLAVYGSEVGQKVIRCSNDGMAITVNGYERTEPHVDGIVDFPADEQITLEFTRHGIETNSVQLAVALDEPFDETHAEMLESTGIEVTGTGGNFGIVGFTGDISIQVIKQSTDSFIDLGDFENGRITFKKQ